MEILQSFNLTSIVQLICGVVAIAMFGSVGWKYLKTIKLPSLLSNGNAPDLPTVVVDKASDTAIIDAYVTFADACKACDHPECRNAVAAMADALPEVLKHEGDK